VRAAKGHDARALHSRYPDVPLRRRPLTVTCQHRHGTHRYGTCHTAGRQSVARTPPARQAVGTRHG